MTPDKFYQELEASFPFAPTESQREWFPEITDFIFSKEKNIAFLLTGYAGTGKTTLIGSLVKQLKFADHKAVLMAPTGRAAKVMSTYSRFSARTIHKQIYYPKPESGGKMQFQLKVNKYRKTIFIIDEASMIGDDRQNAKLFENGSLLHDVVQYVSSGDQCKLIFVGDPAQLQPVHLNISPALDEEELKQFHFDKIFSVKLDSVVRQAKGSGILNNATLLRSQINNEVYDQFKFDVQGYDDLLYTNNGMDLFEAIENAFHDSGTDQTIFIVSSNKRANIYNENIRKRILGLEDELSVGDQLMVVKNNYFWLSPESKPGFIANGDVVRVDAIQSKKELYGFHYFLAFDAERCKHICTLAFCCSIDCGVEAAAVGIHRHQQRAEALDAEFPQRFGIEVIKIHFLDLFDPGRFQRRRAADDGKVNAAQIAERLGRGGKQPPLADDDAHAVLFHHWSRKALHA